MESDFQSWGSQPFEAQFLAGERQVPASHWLRSSAHPPPATTICGIWRDGDESETSFAKVGLAFAHMCLTLNSSQGLYRKSFPSRGGMDKCLPSFLR
eukprot:5195397-Pyramimonas_sp.AAC.1